MSRPLTQWVKGLLPLSGWCGVGCALALWLAGCVAATGPEMRESDAGRAATGAVTAPVTAPVTALPRPELLLPPPPPARSEAQLWQAAQARASAFEPLFEQDLANLRVAELPPPEAVVATPAEPRRVLPAASVAEPAAPAASPSPTALTAPSAGLPDVRVVATYTTVDGLPSNRITALYVDDEDAWVGTADAGVGRFNFAEKNWLVIQQADGLASNRVTDVTRFGERIYVGTQEGLSIWDGASWSTLSEQGKVKLVNTVLRVHQGKLWVAARTMHGGLLTFDGQKWEDRSTIRKGSVLNNIADLRFSGDDLWIGTTNRGVYRLTGAEWQSYTVAEGIASNFVYTLDVRGNTCYLGGCCGLSVLEPDGWRVYDIGEGLPHSTVNAIAVDGNVVWLGSKKGLAVFDGLEFVNFYTRDGLTDDRITSLFVHRNQVWVGTADGLTRLEKSY